MSRVVRMTTSLPSGPDARLWVSLDTIVVQVDDRTCVAHQRWMNQGQLAELATVLTEAAQVPS